PVPGGRGPGRGRAASGLAGAGIAAGDGGAAGAAAHGAGAGPGRERRGPRPAASRRGARDGPAAGGGGEAPGDRGRRAARGGGRAVAERLVASLGQEMLPAMAERLARQQLEQLPGTLAARVEALVPQLREQMLETARRTATAATRQQIEVEGRGALEAAIRQ